MRSAGGSGPRARRSGLLLSGNSLYIPIRERFTSYSTMTLRETEIASILLLSPSLSLSPISKNARV